MYYAYFTLPMQTLGAEVVLSSDSNIAFVRELRPCLTSYSVNHPGGRRGRVYGMSAASARRLRRLLSFVRYTPKMSFLTLTYPSVVEMAKVKRDIDTLFKRIRRRFPSAWGIWKIERQQRGVWHIHTLLVNVPFWHWRSIVRTWSEISGQDASRATNIKHVRSLRQLRQYLAKYIAKPIDTDGEEEHTGRCWGIFNRAAAVFAVCSAYLPYRPYFSLIRHVCRLRYDVQTMSFWVYGAEFISRYVKYYGVMYTEGELTYSQLRAVLL